LLDQYFAEAAASLSEMSDQWDEESMINFVKTYASQYHTVGSMPMLTIDQWDLLQAALPRHLGMKMY